MTSPLFPNVKVKLVGEDGNAFSIMGRIQRAMRSEGIDQNAIDKFLSECKSSDYDNLLQVCMKYVDINGKDPFEHQKESYKDFDDDTEAAKMVQSLKF